MPNQKPIQRLIPESRLKRLEEIVTAAYPLTDASEVEKFFEDFLYSPKPGKRVCPRCKTVRPEGEEFHTCLKKEMKNVE